MHASLKGIALVTGAAQGIGQAIVLRLADDGFDVALNDVPQKGQALDSLAEEVRAKGRQVVVVPGDVSQEEDVKRIVQETTEKLGGLRVMVANAGTFRMGSLTETSLEDFEQLFAVNARGTFLCYKYAAQYMVAQGRGGRILGASSVVGRRGGMEYAAYSGTKFAIRGLTQSAALELGRHGITVNCYAPGPIDTDMLRFLRKGRADKATERGIVTPAAPFNAVGSDGKAEDIASIVSYLASDEAHFITGQTIGVDGGMVLS
ncbi:hypothetical protein HYDPIDRAFT_114838 [Hydnomerulius pinastri MD-312]|uniref:NAD(P)-binding protein n=1 Tax=Hydnomerulius pinastri MD-312 TaxID=994086 RepID=A0A0C9V9F8_9AGAM|nr:hypothetical protein HYDPIDRAFT_114838 [Hydnomerulius pinastri MD-312]